MHVHPGASSGAETSEVRGLTDEAKISALLKPLANSRKGSGKVGRSGVQCVACCV